MGGVTFACGWRLHGPWPLWQLQLQLLVDSSLMFINYEHILCRFPIYQPSSTMSRKLNGEVGVAGGTGFYVNIYTNKGKVLLEAKKRQA